MSKLEIIRTGSISENTHDMLSLCSITGSAPLKGDAPPVFRSSTSNLAVILANPDKYGELNSAAEAIAIGAGASVVTTVAGLSLMAGPAAPIAAIIGGMAASPRLVTIVVVNSLDEDIVLDGSPVMVHGMEAAYPAIQHYNPISDEYTDGPKNTLPGRKKAADKSYRYCYGIWRFEKSKLDIGGWTMPFALYGVQGAMMFKTADGSKTGFGVAFENPQNGKNRIYLTTDGSAWKSIEDFVDHTVDQSKSQPAVAGNGILMTGSMIGRQYPDSNSTKDIVVTINIGPHTAPAKTG